VIFGIPIFAFRCIDKNWTRQTNLETFVLIDDDFNVHLRYFHASQRRFCDISNQSNRSEFCSATEKYVICYWVLSFKIGDPYCLPLDHLLFSEEWDIVLNENYEGVMSCHVHVYIDARIR
jgi:hypothetical protein